MGLETAAVMGIASLAASAVGTGMSFSQASAQRKAQKKAENEAAKSMAEARAKLEVNYADALSIQKEPYERQREALLSAGAQALEQGIESERGGAATAGRVLAAQQEAQGQARDTMSQDLFNLEAMQAEEQSRLRDIGVQLDIGEASGAQQAAAEAENRAAQFQQQGYQGAVNLAGQAASAVPLFSKTSSTKQADIIGNNATQSNVNEQVKGLDFSFNPQKGTAQVGIVGEKGYVPASADFAPAQNIYNEVDITPILNNPTRKQFNDFMVQQDPDWVRKFRKEGLGIQTKFGKAASQVGNYFGSIFN
jgi:hypothetical protein